MTNEQELDQKTINELLVTANKELSELTPPHSDIPVSQEPSITEELIAPLQTQQIAPPVKNRPILSIMTLKQHINRKIVLAIFILFTLAIGVGGYLGYKIADHNIAAQTPLEKIIQRGITFEEKNFVAYAGRGDKEIVNAFLDAGMSVDVVRITDGWSPLMSACFYKKSDIVELLLNRQATVNLQDKYGKTALMHATVMGAEDIVNMLLEYGANPNIPDNNNRTPLIESYSKQHAKIAEILKSAGANSIIEQHKTPESPTKPPLNPTKELSTATLPANITQENRLTIGKAGFVQIGMPLAEIQKKYPSLTVNEKYIAGNKKTIANIYFNNQNNPALELGLSNGTLKLVSTISTDDEEFATDKQINVKSTVGDIRNQYTISDIKIINNSLFLVVKSMKMLFELDLSKDLIPTEWLNTNSPTSIPADTTIKRIVIY